MPINELPAVHNEPDPDLSNLMNDHQDEIVGDAPISPLPSDIDHPERETPEPPEVEPFSFDPPEPLDIDHQERETPEPLDIDHQERETPEPLNIDHQERETPDPPVAPTQFAFVSPEDLKSLEIEEHEIDEPESIGKPEESEGPDFSSLPFYPAFPLPQQNQEEIEEPEPPSPFSLEPEEPEEAPRQENTPAPGQEISGPAQPLDFQPAEYESPPQPQLSFPQENNDLFSRTGWVVGPPRIASTHWMV